jgi:hypothetical protein
MICGNILDDFCKVVKASALLKNTEQICPAAENFLPKMAMPYVGKSFGTPPAEGQRIAYNFVKLHMAPEDKTPAQVAGLDVKGWRELLEKAMKSEP